MKLHLFVVSLVMCLPLVVAATAAAQSPSVIYNWDHAVGSALGDNAETWAGGEVSGSGHAPSVSNATDGLLTVTETQLGGLWQVAEGFNKPKESAADLGNTTAFDFGGIDLKGLDTLEFDVSHNGAGDINGGVYLQPDDGSGCCGFYSAGFTASPGANTISIDLNSLGMSPDEFEYVRSIGFQVFGHAEASPVTWEFSEVRSGGTPLIERVIADYSDSPADLENVVVKFDEGGITGTTMGSVDNQAGLGLLENALRWVDVADGPGGAVAWGNGNALAVDFLSRPLDISNYDTAEITIEATGGSAAPSEIGVQFFAQYADRATNNQFAFAGVSQILSTDGTPQVLKFALADLGIDDLDLTQWIGLNVDPHAGNIQFQVYSVVLTTIPEPSSAALLGLSGVAMCGALRRCMRRQ
jgi:hypothetical protein